MGKVKVPNLGEDVGSAEVVGVSVKVGQRVEADQPILELESDKATFDMPAPRAGVVEEILAEVGDRVSSGQVAVVLSDDQDSDTASAPHSSPPPASGEREKETAEAAPIRGESESEPIAAGPAARKLARELGVDLDELAGQKPDRRVTPEDVTQQVKRILQSQKGERELPDLDQWGETESVELTSVERITAERMAWSWKHIPHVTHHDVADIAELERERQLHQSERDESEPRLTLTTLSAVAVLAALKQYPRLNASFDSRGPRVVLRRYYNLGIAVDTERGLVVPVVHNADGLTTRELMTAIDDVSKRARQGKLEPRELGGGTFTITNLGGIGGTGFTPIIDWPQVAILGLGRASEHRLPLSLSYDHRAINGAEAARFVRTVAEMLQSPLGLLLDH